MQTFFEDRFGWSMEKSELERAVKENLLNFDMTEPEWVEDSLIWFSNQLANYDDAQANCQSMGGQLFEPQTLIENNQVYELMEAKGRDSPYGHWIGINDKAQEGTFVYASSDIPIAFEHWGSFPWGQQPDDGGVNEDCVCFVSSTLSNGPKNAWNDLHCNGNLRYICQKRIDLV